MHKTELNLPDNYTGEYFQVFPTTVGKFKVDSSVYTPVHNQVRDAIYSHREKIKSTLNYGDASYKFNAKVHGDTSFYGPNLIDLPQFNVIGQYFYTSLKTYFTELCDNPFEIAFKNCWFTVYPEGHHIPRHSHPASQFSGVYYFDVTEESGDITFYDPISDFRVWYDEGANPAVPFRPFSEIKIHPETGMFLVFPSWLPHSTLPNKSKRDRIIFSFNFDLWIQKPEHTNNGGLAQR